MFGLPNSINLILNDRKEEIVRDNWFEEEMAVVI